MNTMGLLGRKIGMTQVYSKWGEFVPATVIEAGPCRVLQVKEPAKDGYRALQLGFGERPERKATKPELGHARKANSAPAQFVREIRLDLPLPASQIHGQAGANQPHARQAGEQDVTLKPGDQVTVEIFTVGEYVDVTGISKGKGFQGGMKRWGWSGGPASHGSMSHRRIGAMSSNTFPGRVFRGHHLHGRMGADQITTQGLEVLSVDKEHNVLVIGGSVPGHPNAYVVIRKSFKKKIKTGLATIPKKKEKKAAEAAKAVKRKQAEKAK